MKMRGSKMHYIEEINRNFNIRYDTRDIYQNWTNSNSYQQIQKLCVNVLNV